MINDILKERKALHEHMEWLSCGNNAPTGYFDYNVPDRFAEMYKLSIFSSLSRLAILLTGAYALISIGKALKEIFRR